MSSFDNVLALADHEKYPNARNVGETLAVTLGLTTAIGMDPMSQAAGIFASLALSLQQGDLVDGSAAEFATVTSALMGDDDD